MRRDRISSVSPAIVMSVAMISVACGCVTPADAAEEPTKAAVSASAAPANTKADPGPRVSDDWQKKMGELLRDTSAHDAWGLFSYGGWSNAGQVIVLLSDDRKTRDVYVASPNRQPTVADALKPKRSLKDAELASIEVAIKNAVTLQDIDIEMFDGLEFELVHMTKSADGKAIAVTKRVYVRDPGNKPHPEHQAVMSAFAALKTP